MLFFKRFNVKKQDRSKLLASAIAKLLWKCGNENNQAVLCMFVGFLFFVVSSSKTFSLKFQFKTNIKSSFPNYWKVPLRWHNGIGMLSKYLIFLKIRTCNEQRFFRLIWSNSKSMRTCSIIYCRIFRFSKKTGVRRAYCFCIRLFFHVESNCK